MAQNENSYWYSKLGGINSQVFAGVGTLISVTVNGTAAGTIGIVDGKGGGSNGTVVTQGFIGILKASVVEGTYYYNVTCRQGLRIVAAGASDITVAYKQ